MNFTDQEIAESKEIYIDQYGASCPYPDCNGTEFESIMGVEFDCNYGYKKYTCEACGRSFEDLYTLTDVILVDLK